MAKALSRLFLGALTVLVPAALQAAVARFDTTDIVLQADQTFDGTSGIPSPFTEITLRAQVTSPSGRLYNVTGFFDGDGQGGSTGRVFKVRVFADEAGTWTWRSSSNLPALDGKSGSFQCAGTLPGVFAAGPVEVNPGRPHTFRYRNGQPVYLLGKFLDADAPEPIRFSHTFLSEELADADRQALLDRHLGMRLNKMNVYIANRGDYGSVSTTPWVGTAFRNDKTRFDLARWHTYESWVRRLRDAGMVAHLWFFADDSGFGDLPDADRQRLIRYGMARLSGYANTMFTLALEWQEGWSPAEVQSHAEYLHQQNPWDRLASVHGLTGSFSFPNASWADYMDIQAGNQSDFARVYSLGLAHLALASKPLIQEEHGLGEEDEANRRNAWAAFMGGAGGSGTGAFLEPLSRFVATVPFERLAPDALLVPSGGAYALADPGKVYVFYFYEGGSALINLTGTSGSFAAEWLDPRTGTVLPAPDVAGGGFLTFTAPGSGDDRVLALRKRLAPQASLASFYTISPCRALDTRSGEPFLAGERRRYALTGTCGIPAGAQAVAVNLTAATPSSGGYFTLWPGDRPKPPTSAPSFAAGQTRANFYILPLGADGTVLAETVLVPSAGTVHLVVDVTGYFL